MHEFGYNYITLEKHACQLSSLSLEKEKGVDLNRENGMKRFFAEFPRRIMKIKHTNNKIKSEIYFWQISTSLSYQPFTLKDQYAYSQCCSLYGTDMENLFHN